MIAIIDYNAGNTASIKHALDRLGCQCEVTKDFDSLHKADKVIFPGVGQAGSAMGELKKNELDSLIPTLTQPVLGICLGMQLMCKHTEENNDQGLGIFDADVKLFKGDQSIPHMGWNEIDNLEGALYNEISNSSDFYFAHSYYVPLCKETNARCQYMIPFSVGLQKDNFYGVQFHPEKSGNTGSRFLENFMRL